MQTAFRLSNRVKLSKVPDNKLLMLKAAFKRSNYDHQIFDKNSLPQNEYCIDNIKLCRQKIARYHKIVLWESKSDIIHPCYLHTLAFPLHMKLILLPHFPFSALGLVHINNQITQFRATQAEDTLSLRCRFGRLQPHAKGWSFQVSAEYYCNDELVWSGVSRYLARTKQQTGDKATKISSNEQLQEEQHAYPLKLEKNLGRQYALVSGDFNPIHLFKMTAKIFGFRQHIAHGMWTKAFCLSMLEQLSDIDLTQAFKVDINFKQPLLLPNQISFYSQSLKTESLSTEQGFSVQSCYQGQSKIHLLGEIQSI